MEGRGTEMMETMHFRIASANRLQQEIYGSSVSLSAVNAAAIAGGLSWEESFLLLLAQGKRYGLMLTDMKCIRNMILEAGYIRVKRFTRLSSWTDLSDYLMKNYPCVSHALIRILPVGSHQPRFCAVRRLPDPEEGFVVMDTREQTPQITSLYLDYRESGEPKPETEPAVPAKERKSESHRGYLYYQPNPMKRMTGDCVIRAYSAVFNLSWEDTLDLLARSSDYQTTVLNSNLVYRFPASEFETDNDESLKEYAKGLSVKEFCDRMTLRCHHGERFFVDVGKTHVVAIIPTVIDNVPQYAAADSWDSSDCHITMCWVFRPVQKKPAPQEKAAPLEEKTLSAGIHLVHPAMGLCTVREVDEKEGRVTLSFPSGGEKTLALSWVLQKCRREN